MAAYVADGEVERRGAPPRPTTATGGVARASTREGGAISTRRPGSAPSSAGASPIKGIARRVHPSALASPVRATAAGAAASKKADDERRREEGRRSMRERASAERAERQGGREPAKVVKAKVVTRHAPPSAAQSHAVTALWDKIAGACEGVSVALDECARAMVEPDPNRGTPGFGASNAGSSSGGPTHVSGTTRRKNASRASLKLREARSTFNGFAAGFDELRRHSAALAAALHRSETSGATVTEQLASTAGYAEETTNRLRKTAREKEVAEMTLREAKSALSDALSRIEVLEKERRDVDGYEARLEEADYARANFAKALERAEKAESSAARHKEGVAKLTADNMVFLMRLKETETEIAALRKETADARIELEAKRGAWFDRARKDVERVVQRAIKRAEEADAALEAEFGRQEQKAEEYAAELAKIDDVRAENELLAMAAAKAQKAAEHALMEKVKIHEELQRWKTKEFDATSSAKASTTAAAEAYESAGVLRKELAETKAELEGMRSFVDAARAEAEAKTRALANQQAVNAGVMRMKNAMEWRVLEMQAALEKAGAAAPPPTTQPPADLRASSTNLGWAGVGLPPTPASVPVPPVAPPTNAAVHPTPSNAGNEIRTIPGFELSPLPQSDLKDATPRLAAGFDDEQTADKVVHRSAPAPSSSSSDAASFARFRAMFPDLQTPEEMDDLAALDALDVAGAPALATDAKLSGDATPPPKKVSRKRKESLAQTTDPSRQTGGPASTAAPLIAKGARGNYASYGATAPFGGFSEVSGPQSPTRGPEVRQTKKSAAAAAANRAMYASVESVKSLADDEARARAIDAAKAARSTPPASPTKATPAADEKAEAEFDDFLREIDEDAPGSDHPYQPLASESSDGEASDRVLRAPPNPWAGDPRAAEGAAASPGPDFPHLGAMTLGMTSTRSPEKRSPKTSPAKGVPNAKDPRPPSSAATRAGASFKASMAAAAAAAAAGSVKDSEPAAGGHGGPSDDEISADALEEELRRNARNDEEILRAFQASARADEQRAAAEAANKANDRKQKRGGIRAEFLGDEDDDDDGHEIVGEDVFERAAARAMANKEETGSPVRRAPPEQASSESAFDGPGWIGAGADSSSLGGFGAFGARSNSAHTSVLAVDGSSDEEQERERVAAGRPARVPAFDDDDDDTSDPDSTDADSIYDVFKAAAGPGPTGPTEPTGPAAARREATLSRFASASNPGLDEEHAAAMERLMATGVGRGRGRDAARGLAAAADDDDVDLPGSTGAAGGGTGFTFSNALPGGGRVAGPLENNTGTSVDRPATARGRSRGGVSFSNALPQIR